jgi:putative salt-induced outer membrane protein YdiY
MHRLIFACWMLLAPVSQAQVSPGPALIPPPYAAAHETAPSAPWQPSQHQNAGTVSAAPSSTAHDPTAAEIADEEVIPEPALPAQTPPATSDVVNESIELTTPPAWYQPIYWFGPSPWDTGIELGINGSSGTSESLSVRTGGYIKRESRFSKLDLNTSYNRTTTGGAATQNNAQLEARNDWLLDDKSPWTLYGTGNVFYDEFQSFDAQVSANTGVGYRFVHEPGLDFIGRVGGGTSREFGGPDERWVPESLVGFEYSQQLSATQKFYGKLDYYPEWEEFGEYRLVADTGWEIELVQPSNLSLKISATDRYDSTPNGAEPHLLNYSVLLLLKL